jgi:UDP-glucuronate decarboxylase
LFELACRVLSMIPEPRSEIVFEELPPDQRRRHCPEIARPRDALGWAPEVALETGVAKTRDYLRAHITTGN